MGCDGVWQYLGQVSKGRYIYHYSQNGLMCSICFVKYNGYDAVILLSKDKAGLIAKIKWDNKNNRFETRWCDTLISGIDYAEISRYKDCFLALECDEDKKSSVLNVLRSIDDYVSKEQKI